MGPAHSYSQKPDRKFGTQNTPGAPARLPHPRRSHDDPVQERDAFRDLLEAMAERARARGCSIERVLNDEPILTETEFYRRLASYLDLPFLAFPVPLDPKINPHDALTAGLAPSNRRLAPDDTPTFLYAPQGARLDWIAKQRHAHLIMPHAQIAITTPSAFRMSVRATFGERIARAATSHLPRMTEAATARSILHDVWTVVLLGFLALFIASLAWSNLFWHCALLALTCFPVLPGLVIKLMALRNMRRGDLRATRLAEEDLPTYSVLVPVYREAAVLPQLMASLRALDYPRSKLDFKLLIEADDVETLSALENVTLPTGCDVVICPRGMPRTKPRALAIGLAYSRSDLVVVYDAEDVPDPDQLKKAAAIFAVSDNRLACLQARLAIDNIDDSWLTRQFALEYASLFDVLLPGLSCLNQPIPLGGTSNHFRRAALYDVGAWDPWNVTEDADLGMRLYRAGYRVKTFNSTTYEEAPAAYKAWINQRSRWLKGWMQTAIVHMRPHRTTRNRMMGEDWIMLILAVSFSPMTILFHPTVLISLDLLIHFSHGTQKALMMDTLLDGCFLVMCCASFVFDIMIVARGAAERGIKLSAGQLLGLIPYSHLKCWAAWRGLFELLHAPFLWRKTDHGLARTSRRKAKR